uniref:hypothetical protein n=1 Tax=Hypnea nidulans TaxID=673449 RepID=UPI0027D9D9A1|nr:hypothetical protein REP55_pgp172 [Hypnea nidulans]WCH54464.1 hypothetical protein [Hypnea nidulans]
MIRIYLVSLIVILSAACFITTIEIYRSLKNYKFLYLKNNKHKQKSFDILQVYIKQKNWLTCIIKIEKKIKKEKDLPIEYYNIIGYCYYSIKIYHLASYYYKKALNRESNNIITLLSLGKIYILMKKYKEAYEIYNVINTVDSKNIIARKKLKTLIKYL